MTALGQCRLLVVHIFPRLTSSRSLDTVRELVRRIWKLLRPHTRQAIKRASYRLGLERVIIGLHLVGGVRPEQISLSSIKDLAATTINKRFH